jgi:signal transduction histidine kinase
VEQHTGEITVETREGEGTEFRITLPVAAVAAGGTPR